MNTQDLMRKKKHKECLVILFLLFLVIIFFKEAFFFKGFFLWGDDHFRIRLPLFTYIAPFLRKGILPMWTSSIFCGYPLIEEIKLGLFYPLNLPLFGILPFHLALNIAVIIHYFLMLVFMYLYTRELGLDRVGCIISAMIFSFNGFLVDYSDGLHILSTITWLPLILFFIERMLKSNNYVYVVIAGMTLGIQFLGGGLQYSYYIAFLLGGYFLLKFFELIRQGREGLLKKSLKLFLIWIIIFVVGIGIFAVQLLPTYELTKQAARQGVTYGLATESTGSSLLFRNIIESIFPNFYGGASAETFYPVHIGFVSLILALIGAFTEKKRICYFYSLVCIGALTLSLGKASPLFWLLYHLRLPGFFMFKDPIRIIFLSIFSISVLAGFGFNSLFGSGRETKNFNVKVKSIVTTFLIIAVILLFRAYYNLYIASNLNRYIVPPDLNCIPLKDIGHFCTVLKKDLIAFIVLVFSFPFFLFLAIYNKGFGSKVFKMAIVLFVFLNLYIFGRYQIKIVDRKEYENFFNGHQKITKFFMQKNEHFRVFYHKSEIGAFANNAEVARGIDSVSGLSSLPLRRYLEFTKGDFDIDPFEKEAYPDFLFTLHLISLLNCKYIITPIDSNEDIFKRKAFEEVYRDDTCRIFLYKDYLPRAFFVNKALVIKDKKEILNTLKSESFDPKDTVILEEDIGFSMSPELLHGDSEVKITKYLPNEVTIETDIRDNGLLVLLDTYYPGWKVYVDGKKDKIYRANYLFRAVYLDGGNHSVKFTYDPLSFKMGAFVTLFTLLCSVTALAAIIITKR